MLIIARTDANQTYGFDEAIARLQEAVQIGVDVVFFEALKSRDEAVKVCDIFRETQTPVLLNVVPGGFTPLSTVEEAREIGFRIVIYPALLLESVIRSASADLKAFKETGVPSSSSSAPGEAEFSIKDAFNLCGLQECIHVDEQAGGKAYSSVGR